MENIDEPKTPPSPQPKPDEHIGGSGISDAQAESNPYVLSSTSNQTSIQTMAYGGNVDIGVIAYGGNPNGQALYLQSGRVSRLQRGVPRMRRGVLVASVPRTKSQTIYTRDSGQALQNKILSPGAVGSNVSGVPSSGTTNKRNIDSGAINRYRTPYPTLIQPTETNIT